MGNKQTTFQKQALVYAVKNTGIKDVETPHYRNIYCESQNNGNLVDKYWDDVSTCHQAFLRVVREHPKNPCVGTRKLLANGKRGDYEWETYKAIFEKVKNLGAGLRGLGVSEGDKIGIYSANRPEWIVSLQACYAHSFVSVPLYDTLGPDALKHIIEHAEIKIIICSTDKLEKLSKMNLNTSKLAYIVHMDDFTNKNAKFDNIEVFSMNQLMENGMKKPFDFMPPSSSDLASICYTSGVTGEPKGVMITHGNLASMVAGSLSSGVELLPTDVYLSYLPLAHMYERMVIETLLSSGSAIGFFGGDILNLMDDIYTLEPTIFAGVPRVLNKMYNKLMDAILLQGGMYQNMFDAAYSSKLSTLKSQSKLDSFIWDKTVFSPIKKKLGGKIKMILSGSAPLNPDIHDFFKIILSCPVTQGYGLTETCASATCQTKGDNSSGGVGVPFSCCEIKLVSVPEMEYSVSNYPPQGEICIRGPNVFVGYYKQPEKTKEVCDQDGWFHTGDIGSIDENGNLFIIDRIKNIFKLSQGIYVAVEKIENILSSSKMIQQIFVYGDSSQSVLMAVVVPNFEYLKEIEKTKNTQPLTNEDICNNEEAKKLILKDIAKISEAAHLPKFEYIKDIFLEHIPFSEENGLLTSSYKLKRVQATKKYKEILNKLYDQYTDASPTTDAKQSDPEPCIKENNENTAPEAPLASSFEKKKILERIQESEDVITNDNTE